MKRTLKPLILSVLLGPLVSMAIFIFIMGAHDYLFENGSYKKNLMAISAIYLYASVIAIVITGTIGVIIGFAYEHFIYKKFNHAPIWPMFFIGGLAMVLFPLIIGGFIYGFDNMFGADRTAIFASTIPGALCGALCAYVTAKFYVHFKYKSKALPANEELDSEQP